MLSDEQKQAREGTLGSSDAPVAIYALYDGQGNVRYIGKSVRLSERLKYHQKTKTWVSSLEVLEWAASDSWTQREQFWIKYFRSVGPPLVNKTDGGEGLHGLKFSDEHKEKIRQSTLIRFRSPQERARQGENNRRRKLSATTKEKIREAANKRYATGWRHKMTGAHREKIRQANLRRSPELIEAIRRAVLQRDGGHYKHSAATIKKIRLAQRRHYGSL